MTTTTAQSEGEQLWRDILKLRAGNLRAAVFLFKSVVLAQRQRTPRDPKPRDPDAFQIYADLLNKLGSDDAVAVALERGEICMKRDCKEYSISSRTERLHKRREGGK
jgi:hypothetical protein